MRKEGGRERGWFVGAGRDFVLAVERGEGGVEVSYGVVDAGGGNGIVVASSVAGREGGRAFGEGGARGGTVGCW
jgi:hypothetical protein